jgi:hypothetical protein
MEWLKLRLSANKQPQHRLGLLAAGQASQRALQAPWEEFALRWFVMRVALLQVYAAGSALGEITPEVRPEAVEQLLLALARGFF